MRQLKVAMIAGVLSVGALWASGSHANEDKKADDKINFESTVWPILRDNCLKCHGPSFVDSKGKTKHAKEGVRMDNPVALMKGGKEGKVIIPKNPDKSKLYTLTTLGKDNEDVMPAKGDLLTAKQQDILKAWIMEGANVGTWKGATEEELNQAFPKGYIKD